LGVAAFDNLELRYNLAFAAELQVALDLVEGEVFLLDVYFRVGFNRNDNVVLDGFGIAALGSGGGFNPLILEGLVKNVGFFAHGGSRWRF
jgi:hypothetical protein